MVLSYTIRIGTIIAQRFPYKTTPGHKNLVYTFVLSHHNCYQYILRGSIFIMRPESRYEFRIHMNVLCGMSVFGFRLMCVSTVSRRLRQQPALKNNVSIGYIAETFHIGIAKPIHDAIKMYYVLFSCYHWYQTQIRSTNVWLRCVFAKFAPDNHNKLS